jgi:hypothetical protein
VCWGRRQGSGRRKEPGQREHHELLSTQGQATGQHLSGASGILDMMSLPSKKEIKAALEVFAIFQWALSVFLISECSGYPRMTILSPGVEGSWVCGMFSACIGVVSGKAGQ